MGVNISLKFKETIAELIIDVPDKKVNVLSMAVMQELDAAIDQLALKPELKALCVLSGKKGSFVAGADINEIQSISESDDAIRIVQKGQSILNRLSTLNLLSVALVDGVALGGGLELALACDYIVVTDNPKTKLGLPEVGLGIIPGFGGTQRLPRKIGLKEAIKMIISGKPIDAKKAQKCGVADHMVSTSFAGQEMTDWLEHKVTSNASKPQIKSRSLEHSWLSKTILKRLIKKKILSKTNGHYPAPLAALNVAVKGIGKELDDGLAIEAKRFSELVISKKSKNLQHLFFQSEKVKKHNGVPNNETIKPIPIHQAAIFGAGLMGGGIAWLLSKHNINIRLKDVNLDGIQKGFAQGHKINKQLLKLRKMKKFQAMGILDKWSSTTTMKGLKQSDIVIEAIVEDMNIKKKVFGELEEYVSETTILASNTSSLSINDMGKDLKHPERFIGMHFFSPVNRMPLVEVIPSEKTNKETIVSTVKLAQKCGKMPIVVQDCPGFLVNRILLPYINEAIEIWREGVSIKEIDKTMEAFGMPVGPLALLDEVGLDIGLKVSKVLAEGYGERIRPAEGLDQLVDEHQLFGKKSGKGFYIHNGKGKYPNESLRKIVPKTVGDQIASLGVKDRMMLVMINEAVMCLSDGIVASADDLDIAMIFGTGFPPFRGGLCKYADSVGMNTIYDQLVSLEKLYGVRFKPAPGFERLVQHNQTLYSMKGAK